MPVMRVNKNKNYTTMSNTHLRDLNLSLKARGLLSTILSLPDNWNYSINGLVSICKENESSVKSGLNELKRAGYMVVEKLYSDESGTGKFKYVYNIFENPEDSEKLRKEIAEREKNRASRGENPPVENLPVESPWVENHPLNKYTDIISTDIINTDKQITEDKYTSPSKEDEGVNVYLSSEERRIEKPYCPNTGYTNEQLRDYIKAKIPMLVKQRGGLNVGTQEDLIDIILYFYQEYNRRNSAQHPVLSNATFSDIIQKYECPPETMCEYGAYGFADYKEVIDKYFETDFGRQKKSEYGNTKPITRLLPHFMCDNIREYLYRRVTGL